MKRQTLSVPVCLLLMLAATVADAQRAPLSDAPSPQQLYELQLELPPHEIFLAVNMIIAGGSSAMPPLTGYIPNFDVRLDTREYVGKTVRIYLRLPTAIPGTDSIGDIEMSWLDNGAWLAGSVSPGQEALLFEGLIVQPITGGVLNLQLSVGAGSTYDFVEIEPLYEIEVID